MAVVSRPSVGRPSGVVVWMKAPAAASGLKRCHTIRGRSGPSNCCTVSIGPSPNNSATPGPDTAPDRLGATAPIWTSWPKTVTWTGGVRAAAASIDRTPSASSPTPPTTRRAQRRAVGCRCFPGVCVVVADLPSCCEGSRRGVSEPVDGPASRRTPGRHCPASPLPTAGLRAGAHRDHSHRRTRGRTATSRVRPRSPGGVRGRRPAHHGNGGWHDGRRAAHGLPGQRRRPRHIQIPPGPPR